MRFLSFSQPWLWSITDLPLPDAKRIENRSWPPSIELIGETIALHAASSWDNAAISRFIAYEIEHPARRELYTAGAITGVATIDRVVTETVWLERYLPSQLRWFFTTREDGKQNYGWVLTGVVKLPRPIPMKGGQGLRHLTPGNEKLVRAQLEEVASGRSSAPV